MKRGLHYLHCTGDRRILPDLRGTYVRSADDMAAKVQRRLQGLRAALPADIDWSAWMVDVHDAQGRHVVYVDFDPGAGWDRQDGGSPDEQPEG